MSPSKILSQLPDYPYELFVDEIEDGRHVCLIDGCDKEFATYDDYLEHYLYNNSHINFMKRNLMRFEPREGLGEELVWDPIEKQQIEWNIKNNPDYEALKYNRDMTWLLEEKIRFAVKHNRSITAEILGIPGTGKSKATIALGYVISGEWAEKLQKETVVELDFQQAEILELIGNRDPGDTLIQDEDPTGFGTGSKTNEAAFENLAKTLRKKRISILVVSPIPTEIRTLSFKIEFFAYYPKARVTKGVLYTRKGLALGYVYIEILDDEDYAEYEKAKDAFIEMMQKTGGFGVQNYSDARIQKDFDALLEYVKKKDPEMTKTRVLGCSSVKVRGDAKYQQMIADDVYEHLRENRQGKPPPKKEPVRVSKQGVDYEWHHRKTEQDIGILEDLYQFAKDMDLDDNLKRGLEAWRFYYLEELSHTMATKELNKMFPPMDRKMYFRKGDGKMIKFVQGPMGTAGELAAQKWFYPDHKHVGGNDAPDLISPTESIVEVKVKELEEKKGPENLLKDDTYIRDYIARRVPITVVVINYSVGAVSVDFFSILYNSGGIEDGI
jgi:hypothetical protein